jgi:hypothetical protein
MNLLALLEKLLSALLSGNAGESERLMHETRPLFETSTRELTFDELSQAVDLHGRCTAAAQTLREKMLAELGDLARSRRAAMLYRVHR